MPASSERRHLGRRRRLRKRHAPASRLPRRLWAVQNMEEVVFEVGGGLYPLPERQATILAEKLRLFAQGKFPDDVRRLAAGAGWIEGAGRPLT